MTPKKVAAWEKILDAERNTLNPAAPSVRVFAAERLTEWCNRYPGFVLARRGGGSEFLSYEAWGKSATSKTRQYVSPKAWDEPKMYVKKHVDFANLADDACLVIRGIAGVGKTRFVYETLGQIFGISNLCVYSSTEQAVLKAATLLANSSEKRAVIVADECLNETRKKLNDILSGHRDRVRVVAMNNAHERIVRGPPLPLHPV
jgi:hypothetical protein